MPPLPQSATGPATASATTYRLSHLTRPGRYRVPCPCHQMNIASAAAFNSKTGGTGTTRKPNGQLKYCI